MGVYRDSLAAFIVQEQVDNNATREDFERALDLVFPRTQESAEQIVDEILDENYGHLDPEQDGNFADGLEVALGAGDVDYDGIRAMMERAVQNARGEA